MSQADWEERYRSGMTPWDIGVPDEHLVEVVEGGRVAPARALEIGCGTGTNARWLAERGFSVVAVDLSQLAVDKAKSTSPKHGSLEILRLNFLEQNVPGGPFDFVFDRGCFHVFDEPGDRARFAERVASLLAPEGRWLSLIGSTEGPDREVGPPRRSARDVAEAIEPVLKLVELRLTRFGSRFPEAAAAWFCLAQFRAVPAQPSTKR
jgi:methyl halide transferase